MEAVHWRPATSLDHQEFPILLWRGSFSNGDDRRRDGTGAKPVPYTCQPNDIELRRAHDSFQGNSSASGNSVLDTQEPPAARATKLSSSALPR